MTESSCSGLCPASQPNSLLHSNPATRASCPTLSYLRAFARAVPPAWDAYLPEPSTTVGTSLVGLLCLSIAFLRALGAAGSSVTAYVTSVWPSPLSTISSLRPASPPRRSLCPQRRRVGLSAWLHPGRACGLQELPPWPLADKTRPCSLRRGGAEKRQRTPVSGTTNTGPYLRPLLSASKIFFTCCGLGSGQTDPFRSVPYILEDLAGIRALTEFPWMDFL